MNLHKITEEVVDCAKTVGEFIREERKTFSYTNVEIKGLNDFVFSSTIKPASGKIRLNFSTSSFSEVLST